jgi:hypothetical protein
VEQWARLERALALRRTFMLAFVSYLTYESYRWSTEFATLTDKTGVEVAAIIAAVTTPVSLLAVMVFKSYVESGAR